MEVPLHEQETVIRFNKEEQMMEIYTAYPVLMRKLSNSDEYTKVREDRADGKVVAMYFQADKKLLTLRTKKVAKREMTLEEKETARINLAKINSKRRITAN